MFDDHRVESFKNFRQQCPNLFFDVQLLNHSSNITSHSIKTAYTKIKSEFLGKTKSSPFFHCGYQTYSMFIDTININKVYTSLFKQFFDLDNRMNHLNFINTFIDKLNNNECFSKLFKKLPYIPPHSFYNFRTSGHEIVLHQDYSLDNFYLVAKGVSNSYLIHRAVKLKTAFVISEDGKFKKLPVMSLTRYGEAFLFDVYNNKVFFAKSIENLPFYSFLESVPFVEANDEVINNFVFEVLNNELTGRKNLGEVDPDNELLSISINNLNEKIDLFQMFCS